MAKKFYKDLLNETRNRIPLAASSVSGPSGLTTSATGGSNVFVGATAPIPASQGDLWFNTVDATLYISLYDDSGNLVFVRPQ